ncbi:MAG: hypothetical protein LBV74_16375 [Tannerella sp.]|jgi:hypothetical protein|nr:hypothetical protein [Tannerella sp.]
MKYTFKALLLQGLFYLIPALSGSIGAFAQNNESYSLEGDWIFERAEYFEQSSPGREYQLRYSIEKEDALSSVGSCYQELVRAASFYNNEVAKISCMYSSYVGKYMFPIDIPSVSGEKKPMLFGDPETIGQASPVKGMAFNAPQIEYLVEYIDYQTISFTVERLCYENGVTIQGAVKCILTRESPNPR